MDRWTVKECTECAILIPPSWPNGLPRQRCMHCGEPVTGPFEVVRATGARSSDPDTSKLAALANEPRRGTQRAKALDAFRRAYPYALTAAEVESYTGIKGVWKRISELKQGGHIVQVGTRRNPGTGQDAETFTIANAEALF